MRKRALAERRRLSVNISQVTVAALLGCLAFAIVVQVGDDGTQDYAGVRGENLVELLKSLDSANERLSGQIDELTATRDELLSSTRRSEQAQQQAAKRAEELAILSGSVGATGSGIQVTIHDPSEAIDAGVLLDAVEELRAAGAEVIAINGVARVVASTYFLDDANQIRVGGREITRPYRIDVIGKQSDLTEAVTFPGGPVDSIEGRGGTVQVVKREKVTITALADVKSPEYARPTS